MSISVLPRRRPLVTDGSIASIHGLEIGAERSLPIFSMGVSAGFPSPAEDHLEGRLDLNEHLIPHPTSTFFVRAAGDSMIQAGIFDGDLLVVDRSIEQRKGRIVIASLHGDHTSKMSLSPCLRMRALQPRHSHPASCVISEMALND